MAIWTPHTHTNTNTFRKYNIDTKPASVFAGSVIEAINDFGCGHCDEENHHGYLADIGSYG